MRRVKHSALSFGLAGTAAGVPFHTHGAVFAEVFFGRKRWFVAEQKPLFDGINTTLYWFRNVLPTIQNKSLILDGICERGDLLYLPSFFWHSTLNIGQCVFMSVFI
jgi:ribosomal protein L16 Arg81 hydroxylase